MAKAQYGIDCMTMDTWQESMPADLSFLPPSQLSSQSAAQAIEKKESIEIVQALLHGSVSK